MRIFFDTEFYENGKTIELISIGLVREDGATYYAETILADFYCKQSSWLIDNVRPHLKGAKAEKYHDRLQFEITEFVGRNPEFWAYFGAYDWVVLCQLFGTMMDLPKTWPMYCRDVKQEADRVGANLPKQDPGQAHNALADALWTKQAWEYLQMRTRVLDTVNKPIVE